MIASIIGFIFAVIFGLVFARKMYLQRVAQVLAQMGMENEQVDKVVYLVTQYSKIQREARKATKEAYKQSLVSEQLAKIKEQEEKHNG